MAHDFLGTFNKSQFERFIAFAKSQLTGITARITHLDIEASRVGTVGFTYDGSGVPTAFTASGYIGKLLAAYEVMGGDPGKDLRVRTSAQPVFVLKGTEQSAPQFMSNGEVIGAPGLADGPSAELVRQAKGWLEDTCQHRFDGLERKIRRAVDYADQLQEEKARLEIIQAAATTDGSLENVEGEVLELINNSNYRAIYDDGGKDPYGLLSYAPFSSYDVKPSDNPNIVKRVGVSAQRQNSGVVLPGEEG